MVASIAGIVRHGAREHPSRPAIVFGDVVLTYAELDRRSDRVATGLRGDGVVAGDRIALLDANAAEQFEVMFAASKLGAVIVPINWRLAAREIAGILEDCGARVLFAGREYVDSAVRLRSGIRSLERLYGIGIGNRPEASDAVDYGSWRDRQPPESGWSAPTAADEPALLLYTSGTTGLPKGVALSSRNLFTLLDAVGPRWGLGESTRSIVCLPLFHIGGIGWALAALRFGGAIFLMRAFDPEALPRLVESARATHVNLVPAMIRAMLDAPATAERDLSSLRMILYGTAPIGRTVLRAAMKVFRCPFRQVYGLTETTSAITELDDRDHQVDDDDGGILLSAGRPYPWVQTRIVDPTTGRPSPLGSPGELWVRSAQNMIGYWNNPQATAACIVDGGWLRTGDVARVDDAGYVHLTDRVKDMIVSGGENVYPAEAENVLREHAAVSDVAVIGVPDQRWGETPKALVVLKPGHSADAGELLEFARARMAHYKCPTSVDFVAELPRNAAGKVLKRVLREPFWEGMDRRIG